MDSWYRFACTIVGLYKTLFIRRLYVQGLENIPYGPKIIIGNHPNVTDSFILPFVFSEKLHFAILGEVFTLPVIGRLLRLADQLPIIYGRGQEFMQAARERLSQGNSVVIYPEGRLDFARQVHRAGAGAASLALQTGAPVLPLGIFSPPQYIRMIKGRFFNRSTVGGWQMGGPLFLCIGKPSWLSLEAGVENNYRALRKFTDLLMEQVCTLVQSAFQLCQCYGYLLPQNIG